MTNAPPAPRVLSAVIVAFALIVAVACGAPTRGPDRSGGQEPVTARALAAVVEDHLAGNLGHATSARPGLDGARAVGGVGAELRYRAEGEPTAPGVWIAVGTKPGAAEFTCKALRSQSYAGCVAADGGVLFWEEQVPEEDPGVVYVALRKGRTTVLMSMTGPDITKDPRKLDLRISVEDLFAIAKDDRVGATTSASAVHAGEALKSWTDHG
jgi:hypothetical protein